LTDRSDASIHPLLFNPVPVQSGGSVYQSGRFSSTPRAERRLDEILDPYEESCEEVLSGLGTSVARMGAAPPWATICLPGQYPLSGHFLSVRKSAMQLSLSSYERSERQPEDYAEVGILTVWNKQSLEDLATRCFFLEAAWMALRHLSDSRSWLIFAPEPHPTWLAAKVVEDRQMHELVQCLERMRRSVYELTGLEPGSEGEGPHPASH